MRFIQIVCSTNLTTFAHLLIMVALRVTENGYYLRLVNRANGADTVFVRCVSVCVSVRSGVKC